MKNCEALTLIPYFRGLKEEIVCSILDYSHDRRLLKGERLFTSCDTCTSLYIIKGGLVEISQIGEDGKKIVLHHAGQGAFLGDTILFNEGKYEANAYALKDSELLSIEKKGFESLIYTYPEIGIRMLGDFGTRIKRLKAFAAEIALRDVRERIIKLLLELVRDGNSTGKPIVLTNVPTQDEMAFRIGTVREVLCRELHKLEKINLVKVKRGEVIIFDIKKLSALLPQEERQNLFPIILPEKHSLGCP
ncbi:MAG: Crp/Fnr family transcriptional regulator [Thermodesulfovibrionales bacterium]